MCSLCLETNVTLINNICQVVECKECGDLVHDIVNDMCLMCNVLEDNARYLDTNVELGYSETS